MIAFQRAGGSKFAALLLAAALLPLSAHRAAAEPSYSSDDDQIRGRIIALSGRYQLTIRDDRGRRDSVTMHPGTIINPLGLTLSPGMRVTIYGHGDGGTFDADEIDTPYRRAQYGYPGPIYYPVEGPYGYPGYYGPYGGVYPGYYGPDSTIIINREGYPRTPRYLQGDPHGPPQDVHPNGGGMRRPQ